MALPQQQIDLARRFIDQVRREPIWFAEQVLNHRALPGESTMAEDPKRTWELDKFQCDILEAVADVWRKKWGWPTRINHEGRNYITVRSGHGPGKTHTAALVAHLFNTAFEGRIVCTAPKLGQLRTRVWGALRKIDARAEPWYRSTHVIHDTAVYWKSRDDRGRLVENRDWCILAETASQPENLAGHHERFMLVLVEEATGVTEHLWPVIFGALSSGEIVILLIISNPSKNTGTFADSHLKAHEAKHYFRYHVNLANARRIDRDWAAKMKTKYGERSPYYRIRVEGEFADAGPNQLIALQWLMDRTLAEMPQADGSMPKLRVSVDVADGGECETVVAAAHHYHSKTVARKMERFNFAAAESPIEAGKAAERMFLAWGGDKARDEFVVDAVGVGAGTAGWLIDRGYRVIAHRGGESSDDPKRWRNRRTQSYINLRNALRDGSIELAPDMFDDRDDWEDFYAQMCSIETTGTDKLDELLTKKQMLERGIASPDMADSLSMQYATQVPVLSTKGRAGASARTQTKAVVSNLLEDL